MCLKRFTSTITTNLQSGTSEKFPFCQITVQIFLSSLFSFCLSAVDRNFTHCISLSYSPLIYIPSTILNYTSAPILSILVCPPLIQKI